MTPMSNLPRTGMAVFEEVQINAKMLTARLRAACNLPVVEGADRVLAWLEAQRGDFAPLIGRDLFDISRSLSQKKWYRLNSFPSH